MNANGSPTSVLVLGAGKVGRAFARSLKAAGWKVRLRPLRAGLPSRFTEDGVLLAVRDSCLAEVAEAWASTLLLSGSSQAGRRARSVLHCSGALDSEVLAPLRAVGLSVGQLHPLLSFADRRLAPRWEGAHAQIGGDRDAVRLARRVAQALGMRPRKTDAVDLRLYHAAATVVSNGTAALAAAGIELLTHAGFEAERCAAMLGPLLRSVADNVERLGLPRALTGPVRRGDVAAVGRSLDAIERAAPELVHLAEALLRTQLPLARALGEAPEQDFDRLDRRLATGRHGATGPRQS